VPLYINDSSSPGGKLLNKAAFLVPIDLRQGTLERNALRGFGVSQLDFALRREFHITEAVRLQLRAEAFNIFNRPTFADPISSLTSGLFGRSTQMLGQSLGTGGITGGLNPLYQIGGPRSLQFALKLQF
jgi:hypothetical protein